MSSRTYLELALNRDQRLVINDSISTSMMKAEQQSTLFFKGWISGVIIDTDFPGWIVK
jgi:hypothetical protein